MKFHEHVQKMSKLLKIPHKKQQQTCCEIFMQIVIGCPPSEWQIRKKKNKHAFCHFNMPMGGCFVLKITFWVPQGLAWFPDVLLPFYCGFMHAHILRYTTSGHITIPLYHLHARFMSGIIPDYRDKVWE